jgi:hypothetical protein
VFLEIHGFDQIAKICPRGLRNAIAHQDFKIKEDGSILWHEGANQKDSKLIEIVDQTSLLNDFSNLVLAVINMEEDEEK